MLRRGRRSLLDKSLNLLFVVWVIHILVTGRVIPTEVAGLLHNKPPVAAVHEPQEQPSSPQSSLLVVNQA
jgi:hypothetical protein